jgi:hypothetical protein
MDLLGIHPGALGDVILFVQFLRAVAGPGGRVRLAAGESKARLLAGLGAVEEAVDIESLPLHRLYAGCPDAAGSVSGGHVPPLRAGPWPRADVLVSCLGGGDSAVEGRLAAACGAERAFFLPVRPPEDWPGHLVALWAERVGIGPPPPPRWPVPAAWRAEASRVLTEADAGADAGAVLLCPGAGSPAKCWPLERFEALAAALDRPAVFVVGPVEAERWPAGRLERLGRDFPLVTCPPLEVLAALAASAGAVVANDSGPAHLAAAVGAPTVTIFGPASRAEHFSPRGRRVRVMAAGNLADLGPSTVAETVAEVYSYNRSANEDVR